METLSKRQQQALNARGDVLVLGGPGSGKTTVGLVAARQRIRAGLAPHEKVLFVSFSNSAIYQILRASELRLSSDDRSRLEVRTFHGFCWELLRSHGYLIGLPRCPRPLAPERQAALSSGQSDDEWLSESERLARIEGCICFDLFARLAYQVLEKRAVVQELFRSCFPLLIVDEFQDTDDDQWGVIERLSIGRRLIALADPHQRIYDFRRGVRPERLDEFRDARRPTVVDLEDDNHRSPASDIIRFARHILRPEEGPCRSAAVRIRQYRYANQLGMATKHAIAGARQAVERARGAGPVSMAVLAASNDMVQKVSAALRRPTPAANWEVRHEVFVDSATMANAWRVALAILGGCGRPLEAQAEDVLLRLADFYRSYDTGDGRTKAERLARWSSDVVEGKWSRRTPLLGRLRTTLEETRSCPWNGLPDADIERVLIVLEESGDRYLGDAASWCRIRSPLRQGDIAHDAVAAHFRSSGAYDGIESVFQRSALQERLLDRFQPAHGCSVMTLHRCKGREYDAVVIVDGQREPHRLVVRGDLEPFEKSRRLLRVAVTRARHSVHIVTPQDSPCPLLPASTVRIPA